VGVACGSTTSSTTTTPTGTPSKDQLPGASDTLIFTSDIYAATPTGLREVFSLNSNSPSSPTRLTFNNETAATNNLEASEAPGRTSLIVRRVTSDSNGDGALTEADNAGLVFVNLAASTETQYVPSTSAVSGVDFSPANTDIVYSAAGPGGDADLYDMTPDGQNQVDITNSPLIQERRPRLDPTGSIVAFEYLTAGQPNAVYVFDSSGNEDVVDLGATGGGQTLAGTHYVVGGDADPAFSPQGTSLVFRRLTGIPNALGSWDVLTTTGQATTVLATGAAFRGAPDWGPSGILYTELDPALGTYSIIFVAPDGSGRRVLYTAPQGYTVSNPRWLR
jgi:hypothetical protein